MLQLDGICRRSPFQKKLFWLTNSMFVLVLSWLLVFTYDLAVFGHFVILNVWNLVLSEQWHSDLNLLVVSDLNEWLNLRLCSLCLVRLCHHVGNIWNHIGIHAKIYRDHILQLSMALFRLSGNLREKLLEFIFDP